MTDEGLAARLADLRLWPHHVDTIRNVVAEFEPDPQVGAVLLGGSLAHGYGTEASDVDIVVVVGAEEFARRSATTSLTYLNHELSTYDGGYVDGKYADLAFLRLVAERGSDPARWALAAARPLFSREPELGTVLTAIGRYPEAERREREERFAAQMLAWRWYLGEGVAKQSAYLQTLATAKLVMFTCRLVLARNAMFYPFHKWMLRVVAGAPRQPAGLAADLEALLAEPSADRARDLVVTVFDFYGIDLEAAGQTWGAWFMRDTELSWLSGHPPVDDL